MLRSAYVTAIYLAFLVLGASAPFVFSLGYVWVDTFTPQNIASEGLSLIPVSLVMGAAAIGGYIMLDRRYPPPLSLNTVLVLLLAIWVTLSTFGWAVAPVEAEEKWNIAVKMLLFSAFIPFVFRTRVHIEAFLQIYLFSLAVQFMPEGMKTLISGGGYGRALGIIGGNSGLSEGSTLAAVCFMLVPIILYLRKHNTLLPNHWLTNLTYLGLAVAAVAAAIGTYERTALVGMAMVGITLWLRAKRKVAGALIGAILVGALLVFSSAQWSNRISTTTEYQNESSALGRILVWQWTLGFVTDHPQGGGFNSYLVDTIVFPGTAAEPDPVVVHGKAFHSIFFEMLGEQGWLGLGLFLTLIVNSLWTLQTVARRCRHVDGMEWCRDMAFALQAALLTLVSCGAFIGIAFQPMLYYMFASATCLRQYVRRVEGAAPSPMRARTGAFRVARP